MNQNQDVSQQPASMQAPKNKRLEELRAKIKPSIVQNDSYSATLQTQNPSKNDQEEGRGATAQDEASLKLKSAPCITLSSSPQTNLRTIRENLKKNFFGGINPYNPSTEIEQSNGAEITSEKEKLKDIEEKKSEPPHNQNQLKEIKPNAFNSLTAELIESTEEVIEIAIIQRKKDLWNEKTFNEIKGTDENIHNLKEPFETYFTVIKTLGEGCSAIVKSCTRNSDGKQFAVKIVNSLGDEEKLDLIVREFKFYSKLRHKNIVEMYELYIDFKKNKIYMVMELVQGSELFQLLDEGNLLTERQASGIFKQILFGIEYLHSNGVCHRDLKPHNILVSKDFSIVKIADFNVSKFTDRDKQKKYCSLDKGNYKMWTYTGTIAFNAPEMFENIEYTEAVDLWSAGCVLYSMLSGKNPFEAEYIEDMVEKIKRAEVSFDDEIWKNISKDARRLLRKLIKKDVGEVPNNKIDVSKSNHFKKLCRPQIADEQEDSIADDDLSFPDKTMSQPLYNTSRNSIIRSRNQFSTSFNQMKRTTSGFLIENTRTLEERLDFIERTTSNHRDN